jgi:hypothetical protein
MGTFFKTTDLPNVPPASAIVKNGFSRPSAP